MKSRNWFTAAAVALITALLCAPAFCQERKKDASEIVFFFSPSCHDCQKVKKSFPGLIAKHGGRFRVDYRDISAIENFTRLLELSQQEEQNVKVPSVYFAGKLLVGAEEIRARLEGLLASADASAPGAVRLSLSGDPLARFSSFTLLAVGTAGLVDGINPCAFTVIVFFVSFLALQGFARRHLALIGSFFIAGVFITYLLIGLGLFQFFYKISAFWLVRSIFNWTVGGLSVVLGIAAVIDAVKFARTGKPEGMILSLPQSVKNRIHSVIGARYRGGAAGEGLPRLILSAFATGFIISLLEAVCTGQMYLPTIVFVLKSGQPKTGALAYLLLYNLMFIVPLAVILLCSVFGTSSSRFAGFMSRHFIGVKTLMAVMFFLLGLFLLWRG